MVNRRVKLGNVELETILCANLIPERPLEIAEGAVDAFSLDAGVGVCRELGRKNGLKNIHDGMVRDPIRIVWQPVNLPFLRFEHLESGIGRRFIGLISQLDVKGQDIGFPILIVLDHPILFAFALPGDDIRSLEILQRYDPFV